MAFLGSLNLEISQKTMGFGKGMAKILNSAKNSDFTGFLAFVMSYR